MADTNVSAWLRAETPKHLQLLERLRDRLVRRLDSADRKEQPGPHQRGGFTHGVDKEADEVPDRDWCRGLQRYQAGYTSLLVEERERAKLALMARLKGGGNVLTDEEYERELGEIGRAALKDLPVEDLAAELQRRGMRLPAGALVADQEDEG